MVPVKFGIAFTAPFLNQVRIVSYYYGTCQVWYCLYCSLSQSGLYSQLLLWYLSSLVLPLLLPFSIRFVLSVITMVPVKFGIAFTAPFLNQVRIVSYYHGTCQVWYCLYCSLSQSGSYCQLLPWYLSSLVLPLLLPFSIRFV